jgi:hypothetical protein
MLLIFFNIFLKIILIYREAQTDELYGKNEKFLFIFLIIGKNEPEIRR